MNYISPRHTVRYAWSGPVASQLLRAHPIPRVHIILSGLFHIIRFGFYYYVSLKSPHAIYFPAAKTRLRLFPWSEYIVAGAGHNGHNDSRFHVI